MTPFEPRPFETAETVGRLERYWGIRFLLLVVIAMGSSIALGFQTGIAIVTSAGFLAVLAGFVKPTIGLFGIGMLCVLDSVSRVLLLTGGLLRYNTFNYVLLVALLFNFDVVLKMVDLHTRLLMGMALLMVLGLSTSPDVPGGVFGLLNLTAEFGLLLYFLRAREKGNTLYWVALVNSVLALMACVVFFTQMSSMRPINPNAWAYMPVTALFSVCLAYANVESKVNRALLLGLSLCNVGCVFLSASRGSMLVSLVCVTYLLYQTKSNIVRLSFLGAGFVLLVMATSLFPAMQEYAIHRVDKLFDDRYSLEGRTSGRSELAKAGLQMFAENPFGRGTGSFAVELVDIEGYSKQAHSGWIKTLVENGIVGGLVLAAFVGSFTFVGLHRGNHSGAIAMGLLVTFGMGMAFFSTEFNSKGLWFLAAGATAMLRYPKPIRGPLQMRRNLPFAS